MDDDILMEQFEKVINDLAKKFKDPSMNDRATYSIAYPTTILPLDYVNGLRVGVTELNKDITYSYDFFFLLAISTSTLLYKGTKVKSENEIS